jgi:hypothetical protein
VEQSVRKRRRFGQKVLAEELLHIHTDDTITIVNYYLSCRVKQVRSTSQFTISQRYGSVWNNEQHVKTIPFKTSVLFF